MCQMHHVPLSHSKKALKSRKLLSGIGFASWETELFRERRASSLHRAAFARPQRLRTLKEGVVNKQASVPGLEEGKFSAVFPGARRFGFLYAVIAAAAIAFSMTISGIHGLTGWQTALMVIGTVIVGWAILFSVLEMRRLGKTAKTTYAEDVEAEANAYPSRTLVVAPPTGDPCPHHEDYVESQGFDQGQLTSRLPDATPYPSRRQKQEAAR